MASQPLFVALNACKLLLLLPAAAAGPGVLLRCGPLLRPLRAFAAPAAFDLLQQQLLLQPDDSLQGEEDTHLQRGTVRFLPYNTRR